MPIVFCLLELQQLAGAPDLSMTGPGFDSSTSIQQADSG